MAKIV